MFKYLFEYMKKHKLIYSIVTITLFIDYGVVVIPAKIVQNIIDSIANNTLTSTYLFKMLAFLFSVSLLSYICQFIWVYYLFREEFRFKFDLRKNMFAKIMRMKTPFFEKFRSGDLMTRFTTDSFIFGDLLGFGAMSFLMSVTTLLIVIPTMFLTSVKLSILAIVPIFVAGWFSTVILKPIEKAIDENRDAVTRLSDGVLEVVDGIRVTRAYGSKKASSEDFREKTSQMSKKANKITFLNVILWRSSMIFVSIGLILVVYFGAFEVQSGNLTIGNIAAIQLYTVMLIEPMWVISDFIVFLKDAKLSFSKIDELLKTSDDMETNGSLDLETAEKIEFKNYNFKYKDSENLSLNNINLKIQKGKTLGIVGRTGSGKTTFVRQFLRQYPLGSGQFLINDTNVSEYKISSVENLIGYVPQEHILFSRTVTENIRVGKENATEGEILESIESANFTEDLKNLQNGLETLVGEKGVSISGGQKQRISIARAFIKDPEILILDDSLSAVDAKTERAIIENIQALREGKTNLIVTHRLSAVNHADYVVVFDDGKIVEEGTPSELIDKKGWYFEQYERQQLEVSEDDI